MNPAYDVARSVAPYQGAWRDAVIAFKRKPYGDLRVQASGLLRRMVATGRLSGAWDGIVPVPGRPHQDVHAATVLAHALAKRLRWPYRPLLRFRKRVRPQRGLRRKERLRNLRGALASRSRLHGESLLVIDDVYTTGATVQECARALKAAGALRVGVLTLAHGGDFSPPESPKSNTSG